MNVILISNGEVRYVTTTRKKTPSPFYRLVPQLIGGPALVKCTQLAPLDGGEYYALWQHDKLRAVYTRVEVAPIYTVDVFFQGRFERTEYCKSPPGHRVIGSFLAKFPEPVQEGEECCVLTGLTQVRAWHYAAYYERGVFRLLPKPAEKITRKLDV